MRNLALMIGQKVVFDFMTHFKDDSSMKEIANCMRMLMISSDRPKTFLASSEGSCMYQFIEQTFMKDDC
jgi:hypothetical protein